MNGNKISGTIFHGFVSYQSQFLACLGSDSSVTLSTPMNRKWMPDADHTVWTPLEFVAE